MRSCLKLLSLIFLVLAFILGWEGMASSPVFAEEEEEYEYVDEDEWESADEEQAAQEESKKAAEDAAAKKAAEKEAAQKQAAEKAEQEEAARKAKQEQAKAASQPTAAEEPEGDFEPAEAAQSKQAPDATAKPQPVKQAEAPEEEFEYEDELILEPELEETTTETAPKETTTKTTAAQEAEEGDEWDDEYEYEEEWEEVSDEEQEQSLAKAEKELEEVQKIPTVLTNLEECKRVALMNDRRVVVALREIRFQRCKILQAERDFLPGVKGTYEKQEGASDQGGGGGKGGDQNFSGLKYGIEGTQTVFNGGKLIYSLKQEKTKLAVAKKKFEQARQEAIAKVEKAYYELVKTQMIFQIQTDLSKSAEAALSFSREAYRQGLNPYHDFLNVQSQTDQTYYQLLSAQQDIALAELELRNACNVDASVGIQINAVLTFTDFDFNYSLDECLALALKNRPDLSVNELTTLSDLFGIRLAMAETMPKLEVIGSVGRNGQSQQGQPMELGDEWNLKIQATWVVGANTAQYGYEKKKSVPKKFGAQDNTKDSKTQSLTLALFDKLEKVSDVAKSQVQKATSEADLMELRGKVCKEVDENYFNYQKAMTSVTASLSKIKFREKDLEINRAKQMMNETPLSQVLTSELQLGEERVNYVKALADYYTSISGLFKAMGLSK